MEETDCGLDWLYGWRAVWHYEAVEVEDVWVARDDPDYWLRLESSHSEEASPALHNSTARPDDGVPPPPLTPRTFIIFPSVSVL